MYAKFDVNDDYIIRGLFHQMIFFACTFIFMIKNDRFTLVIFPCSVTEVGPEYIKPVIMRKGCIAFMSVLPE